MLYSKRNGLYISASSYFSIFSLSNPPFLQFLNDTAGRLPLGAMFNPFLIRPQPRVRPPPAYGPAGYPGHFARDPPPHITNAPIFWLLVCWEDSPYNDGFMEDDIRALYRTVTDRFGHDAAISRLSTQTPEALIRPDVEDYVQGFIRDPRNTFVFYYTGHGEQVDGRFILGSYVPEVVLARPILTMNPEWCKARAPARSDGLTALPSLRYSRQHATPSSSSPAAFRCSALRFYINSPQTRGAVAISALSSSSLLAETTWKRQVDFQTDLVVLSHSIWSRHSAWSYADLATVARPVSTVA